jgi:benzil reductase ((S)-benzoin forming)
MPRLLERYNRSYDNQDSMKTMTKLALISGGSKGLGAALCGYYLQQGYDVLEFSRSGAMPYSVGVDLANPLAAEQVFTRTFASLQANAYEEIVAVNNAATLHPIGPVAAKAAADIAANIQINITGTALFSSRVIAAFQAHACPKTIVNISSGAALTAYAGWSLYCMAKAGTEAFFRCAAAEQKQEAHPFRLLNIAPGVIDTDMQAAIRSASKADFPQIDRFLELKRSGSLRSPADVAALIGSIVASQTASGERLDVNEWASRA